MRGAPSGYGRPGALFVGSPGAGFGCGDGPRCGGGTAGRGAGKGAMMCVKPGALRSGRRRGAFVGEAGGSCGFVGGRSARDGQPEVGAYPDSDFASPGSRAAVGLSRAGGREDERSVDWSAAPICRFGGCCGAFGGEFAVGGCQCSPGMPARARRPAGNTAGRLSGPGSVMRATGRGGRGGGAVAGVGGYGDCRSPAPGRRFPGADCEMARVRGAVGGGGGCGESVCRWLIAGVGAAGGAGGGWLMVGGRR